MDNRALNRKTSSSVFTVSVLVVLVVTVVVTPAHWLQEESLPYVWYLLLILAFAVAFMQVRRMYVDTTVRFVELFNHHPHPVWLYDKQTLQLLHVNRAACRQYGYSGREFRQMRLTDLWPEEDRHLGRIPREIFTGLSTRIVPSRHKTKQGVVRDVEIVAQDIVYKKRVCCLVFVKDVTEERRKDDEIRKLSLVAEKTTSGVLITNYEGRIEWVNEAFTRVTGFTLQEAVGQRPRDLLHGPETDKETERKIYETVYAGMPFTGEILNYRKDGSTHWLQLSVSPVTENGRIRNFVIIQTDINTLKQHQEQLEHHIDKLREIAFITSHRLRSPLTNIMALTRLIEEGHGSEAVFAMLSESAEKLDAEVRNIMHQTCSALPGPAVASENRQSSRSLA